MTTLRKTRAALILPSALGLALSATLLTAPAATAAGSSCKGYYKTAHDIRRNAFVGHRVVLDFKTCSWRPYTVPIGPIARSGIRGMSRPVLTLPSRCFLGCGETLKIVKSPYHVSTTSRLFRYRFVIQQSHKATPWAEQNWQMSLQVRRGVRPIARICFVGRSCGAWQN